MPPREPRPDAPEEADPLLERGEAAESAPEERTRVARLCAALFGDRERTKLTLAAAAFLSALLVLVAVLAVRGVGHRPADGKAPPAHNVDGEGWNQTRLPASVVPRNYSLDFYTSLDTFTFSGAVAITLDVKEATRVVVVHAVGLAFSAVELVRQGDGESTQTPVSQTVNAKKEYVVLVFGEQLVPGARYTLQIDYHGKLNDELRGFYRSKHGDAWMAVTQFEPTYARIAFPCFDEPALKATFQLSMTVDNPLYAISNTPVEQTGKVGDGKTKYVFATTPVMSSYLVAFVVSDFEYAASPAGSTPEVRVYTPPGLKAQGEYAVGAAQKILKYYESAFGIAYPLAKLDLIAIPDFNLGAMENWGLVTFRETAILVDEKRSSAANKQRVTSVIAHELAHQWFGNLVTMSWWDGLWLNEAFAELMEYRGVDAMEPEWRIMPKFFYLENYRGLSSDASRYTHSINARVDDPAEIEDIFDEITYQKGSSVLWMLESWLDRVPLGGGNGGGNRTFFFERLHQYLTEHAYGNTEKEDLWRAFESDKLAVNVNELMSSWLDQPGYPVVSVDETSKGVVVKQRRFIFSEIIDGGDVARQDQQQKWIIPFSYRLYGKSDDGRTVSDVQTQTVFLKPSDEETLIEFDTESEILVANTDGAGFFRVDYAGDWASVVSFAQGTVSVLDTAALINDAFDLFFAAQFSGHARDVFDTLALLSVKAPELIPWQIALGKLRHLDAALRGDVLRGKYHDYVRAVTDPLVQRVYDSREEDHDRALLKADVLSFSVRIKGGAATAPARAKFAAIRAGKIRLEDVPSEEISAVLDAGVMHGGKGDYAFVLGLLRESEFAQDSVRYMHALSCTQDAGLVATALAELALDTAVVRKQDCSRFILYHAHNYAAGGAAVCAFVAEQWGALTAHLGGTGTQLSKIVEGALGALLSADEIELWRRRILALDGADSPLIKLAVDKGVEVAKTNAAMLARNRRGLEHVLRDGEEEE